MYPATEMVYSLLQEIEMAVSSSRHGLRVLYKLIERAQDLYDQLNQRISRVETTGNWEDYEIYTQAIDPLERHATSILLEVIPAIHDDRIHLTAPVSSDDLIESADKWLTDNRIICECLRRLGTEAELQGLASSSRNIETEILDANAQDRHDLLNELVLEIEDKATQCQLMNRFMCRPNLRVLIKYVIRTLQSAQNVYAKDPSKAVDEEWCIASIQCAMLSRGMLINLAQVPTSHSLPNDFRWGGVVWKRVLETVSLVNKALPSELPARPASGPPPRDQLATEQKAPATEKPPLSPPSPPEFTEKPREKPRLSVDTQSHDLRPTFKFSQDTFPDPHTPTHAQRLLQYETHNSAIPPSSSPVFSTPSPVTARTPVFKWLPGLQTALALRSSAPLPHAESVGGRLPLYRFLASSFRKNS